MIANDPLPINFGTSSVHSVDRWDMQNVAECETSAASTADGHPLLDELKGDDYLLRSIKMSDRWSRLTQ